MKKVTSYIETGIRYFAYSILVIVILFLISAFFNSDHSAEAPVGDFKTTYLNNNWDVFLNNQYIGKKSLPNLLECKPNDVIIIKNKLPEYISDGMNLMLRASLEDTFVYINGELKGSYATENFKSMSYYLPSAYLMIPLTDADAGKEIEIRLNVKVSGVLNKILLGYGSTPWMHVLGKNYVLASTSIFNIFIGTLVIIIYPFIKKRFKISSSIFYLGLLIINTGIWLLSESRLRQLIFARPSLTHIFSYMALELIGIFAILYFDEIQHKIHHKIYFFIKCVLAFQLILNLILDFTGILDFHQTIMVFHIWLLIGIFIIIANIISDFKHKETKNYKIVIIGIGLFLFFVLLEMFCFYFAKLYTFGPFICIGLILLLFTNIIQIISDIMSEFEASEKKKRESWIHTIETISSAIEAKDEYTGGHSERVAKYAGILAREIATNYNFSEKDIMRIRYIGLMHDIGKIGITDDILNKTGKLTKEEFSLMKKHVEIGSVLMAQVSNNTKDLLDGIRYHHERFDGKGYPDGLKGTNIPLIARILCLADSYDAMTSSRVYRQRLTDKEVKKEILRCSGTQFDPDLAEIFVNLIERGAIFPKPINYHIFEGGRKALRSMVLEECLRKAKKLENGSIINPSRIRLACYIMKLAEVCEQNFEVMFIEPKTGYNIEIPIEDFLEETMEKYIKVKDINIRYSQNKNLVVLFERTDEEIKKIQKEISDDVIISFLPS